MTSHDHAGSGPTADVSVRVGWADDAAGIAEVQVRAWRREYADLLPAEVVGSLDADVFAQAWRTSLGSPGTPATGCSSRSSGTPCAASP